MEILIKLEMFENPCLKIKILSRENHSVHFYTLILFQIEIKHNVLQSEP